MSQTGRNILIVDDDSSIQELLRIILTKNGYTVHQATDGEEAIEAYKKARDKGTPYDVVILDLTVPEGMGGLETIKELLKIDPHVKAIVSSGYHHNPIMANFWEYGFSDCVKKPYMAAKLDASIRNLLKTP